MPVRQSKSINFVRFLFDSRFACSFVGCPHSFGAISDIFEILRSQIPQAIPRSNTDMISINIFLILCIATTLIAGISAQTKVINWWFVWVSCLFCIEDRCDKMAVCVRVRRKKSMYSMVLSLAALRQTLVGKKSNVWPDAIVMICSQNY